MAKQRGIHQIKGKYNDTCYFERKGTRGGLLRRINSGMGERVKFGEEFSNLRAANTIFGACSIYAAIVFNFFSNRALFLFKKNRQSLLTKKIFDSRERYFIAMSTLSVGFTHSNTYALTYMFDSVVTKKFYEVFSGVPRTIRSADTNTNVTITLSANDLEEYCAKYNATGCYIGRVGPCYIYPLLRNNENEKFSIGEYGDSSPRYGYQWKRGEGDLEVTINVGIVDDAAAFGFLYAIPEKEVQAGLPIRLNNGSCCGMYQILIG